jgi:putative nucleotidyltransferase with HDIG domain
MDPASARDLSERLLAVALPDRWAHSLSVAAKAEELRGLLHDDTEVVETAGWLHDIGYAPDVRATGFHALDGARYLRDVTHAVPVVCTLVAHHTCATIEAETRGLKDVLLTEFPLDDADTADLLDALTYCDMSVGPTGESLPPESRLEEILARYLPEDPVHQSISRAGPTLLATHRRVSAARDAGHW